MKATERLRELILKAIRFLFDPLISLIFFIGYEMTEEKRTKQE
jgi:hypothetical protein